MCLQVLLYLLWRMLSWLLCRSGDEKGMCEGIPVCQMGPFLPDR
jgi:hypothetical protein